MKHLLDNRYAELCRELGHLLNNKEKIELRMAELKAEIAGLDSLSLHIKTASNVSNIKPPESGK